MRQLRSWVVPVLAGGLLLLLVAIAVAQGEQKSYLPIAFYSEAPTPTPVPPPPTPPPGHMVEFRGLWITRFDWITQSNRPPVPSTIDKIVDDAANAGFNVLLFQVRGTADAYYDSSVEPWAQRLTGALGQPPANNFDPLARMVASAHERGLQVHAYITVYPVWLPTGEPPFTQPLHLYHLLANEHGRTNSNNNGLQWDTGDQVVRTDYQWATPASLFLDQHLMAVTEDLFENYDLDGIHLDRIRYAGAATSCDPVSFARSGVRCFTAAPGGHASYGDWQRAQVNGTVSKFYNSLFVEPGWAAGERAMLSAAVWFYSDVGRNSFYADSKAWLRGGYIDAIMPMLYGSFDTSVEVWRGLAEGFQRDNAGRFVFPGIAGTFSDFSNIAGRIEASRAIGTQGHAIFSYGGLADKGHFDDLANGPYAIPAVPPVIDWHP